MNRPDLSYEEGGAELFGRVKPLWERLRRHHKGITRHFPELFSSMNFTARRKELAAKSRKAGLRIVLARDTVKRRDAGYAIATIDKPGTAELDSLFVDSRYRGEKIGEELTRRALGWIKRHKVRTINIFAAVGNERVLGFYRKFGFLPYTFQLREKKRPAGKRRA